MHHNLQSITLRDQLKRDYPWTTAPLIVGAPMRVMSGPEMALAISGAGGIGFIGPGLKPESTAEDLETARSIIFSSSSSSSSSSGIRTLERDVLPIGIGFQLWNGSLETSAAAVGKYRPAAAWLFAPRDGLQAEVNTWTVRLREVSPETKIWLQVGTLQEALDAVQSSREGGKPDVLVVQGAEAGGHGRATDGVGVITLIPEIADALFGNEKGKNGMIPLFAAGGIMDGRGAAAALGLGAAGAVMGTRFLAATEARISKGYQDEVLRASDGGKNTLRTQLYNHLRGTLGWPEQWSPRTVVNQSWVEQQAGVGFEELKKRHDRAVSEDGGSKAWGPEGRTATYAGAGVGLVKSVEDAGAIVEGVRGEAVGIIQGLQELAKL
ncbi:hypothetical protein B0H63DRAFT_388207 [Podospora didyma]|uniref:Nitronate monooxygenase domain-containing protein n=1 Tax=Podospora didyma TaxID=330526 RepID=A0AAE0P3C4_9PEZI|nr:hypothetical protein B0H63DRAFT_388207 [Podospora didyma]